MQRIGGEIAVIRPHEFAPDSSATDRPGGKPRQCVLCDLPRENKIHRDVPDDVSARITGDKERTDG